MLCFSHLPYILRGEADAVEDGVFDPFVVLTEADHFRSLCWSSELPLVDHPECSSGDVVDDPFWFLFVEGSLRDLPTCLAAVNTVRGQERDARVGQVL